MADEIKTEDILEDQDIGKFEQRQDGVYLTMFREKRDNYDFDDIRREIIHKGVVNADFDRILEVWKDASGEPEKIADYFERYDAIKDKYIEINVADNEMEAYLTLGVPDSRVEITLNDVLFKLYEAGVFYCVDEELIDKLIKEGKPVKNAVVAKGSQGVDGVDARVELKIDIEKSAKPLLNEDGTVDFKNISLIKVVDKDQLLAVKTPATTGEQGITVFGKHIARREGKDHPMPRGKNTYVSEDGLSLYSELIGNIFMMDGLLHVENVYVVRGNVDFSTGNISYPGDVVINGDVKSDFQVHTEGNIIVRGTVEAAEIVTTKGDVDVKKGIIGTQKEKKAKIIAQGSVKALFIQEGVVSAGKDVTVGSYILNSVIHAENEIVALRDRGLITGSNLFSGSVIRAKTIGSMSDNKTSVKVGKIIKDEVSVKYKDLDKEMAVFDEEERLLNKRLSFLDLLKKRLPHFPPDKEKELTGVLDKIKKLEEIKQAVIKEKEDFESRFIDQFGKERKIFALQYLWPGVLVGINDITKKVENRARRVVIELVDNELEFKRATRSEATGGVESDDEEDDDDDDV